MKIFNIIKEYFKSKKENLKINKDYERYRHLFWELSSHKLLDFIEKESLKLAKDEGIDIFFSSYDEMNKDETIESEYAVGKFFYIANNERRVVYENNVAKLKKINYNLPKQDVYPRIEISEKGDVFTILHELGHYFIYKRNQEQTELGANQFIEEFFKNYLPPFFMWIYQIEVKIRTRKEFKISFNEGKEHYKEYLEWSKNN